MHAGSIQVRLLGILAIGVMCSLIACSGGGGSSSAAVVAPTPGAPVAIALSITPSATAINIGGTTSLTATVSGTTDKSVAWTVDGIPNGNAAVGSISGSGGTVSYSAPSSIGSHVLTATSLVDSSKQASATVTVQALSADVSVALSPGATTLGTSAPQSFTATVSNATNTAVTWFVDAVLNGNSTTGLVTGSGNTIVYTAPALAGSHTLVAVSVADGTKTASSAITVQVGPPSGSTGVTPASSSLSTGGTATFSASLAGATTVSWAVDGVSNGNASVGTIAGTGLTATYTAPATGGTHTITATSVQDSSKSATATVTVTAPATISSVSVNPSTLTLNGSGLNQFTATVTGTGSYSSAVTWSAQRGSITSTGLYTAPSASGSDVVTATSAANGTKTGSCAVTVQTTVVPTGFVVAPNGVTGNPGTVAAPTTLEGARTLIQNASRATAGTLRVLLRGGLYPRSSTFTLGSADSGSTANPVEYAAYPNETPRLIGGVALDPSSIHLVDGTDPNWSRLDASARAQIYVVDLTAYKSSFGTFASRGGSEINQAMEVFVNGAPLTLARYPKAVEPSAAVTAPHASIHVSGTLSPDVTGDYAYKGLDNQGRPYYQLSKGGDVWSIAGVATGPDWRLSNRHDLGGTGSNASWGTWDTFAAPAGAFFSGSGASGTAFLSPTDGSNAIPGFLLIRSTSNGSTQITAPDSHMSRWRASEAMYFGLGYYSWSGSHSTLASLDPTSGSMVLSGTPTYGLRDGQPFFIYNLLEELTAPGDYFIDRVNSRLYLRPVGDVAPTEVLISTLQAPIMQMSSCQNVTWQGVSFEVAKDRLVLASSCQNVAFKNCQFRNAGGDGLTLGGSSNLVEACDFRQLGKGGVVVSGGNRSTLTPSGTVIENSEFQYFGRLFWTYQPGIYIDESSVGITARYNELHHAPHAAIIWGGNGNVMNYNLIHDVTQWTNDAGVIYTTGRDWGMQGNLIQFNLIRNCGSALGVYQSGIYVDGIGSGVKVEGNILYNVASLFAIQHNGGRDVETNYNICVGQWYGIDISNVAFEYANHTSGSSWDLLGKLIAVNYQSAPWSTAYPNVAKIPNSWSTLANSHWLEPEGSSCYGNLQKGGSVDVFRQHNSYTSLAAPTSWFTQVGSNLNGVDPLFTDPANNDFRLQPGSPMFNIPGFPGIDVAQIGIHH